MFALNIFTLAIVLALMQFVRVYYDEQSHFPCFFLLKILNIMHAAERKRLLFSIMFASYYFLLYLLCLQTRSVGVQTSPLCVSF